MHNAIIAAVVAAYSPETGVQLFAKRYAWLLHQGCSPGEPWRVTSFAVTSEGLEPWGHSARDSLEEAARLFVEEARWTPEFKQTFGKP
jgi:hypothetical protein